MSNLIDFRIIVKDKKIFKDIIAETVENKKVADDNFFQFALKNKDIKENDFFKNLKDILKICKENSIKLDKISFNIFDDAIEYSQKDWELVRKIENYCKTAHIEFGFEDGGKLWSVSEVKNSVETINKLAQNISSKNFSPIENILSAYFEVTKRKYTFENEDEHHSQSRTIYGILNSDKIVCVGYSRLFESLLKKLDNKNIKIFQNTVVIPSGRHANCIIYVNDKKYNIDGYYYFDPTWDSSREHGEKPYNLNYFMLPLKDIKFLKQYILTDDKSKDFIKQIKESPNKKIGEDFRKYMLFEGEVTFGGNDIVFDDKFLKEILKNKMYKNAVSDFIRINNKKDLDILSQLLEENNIKEISMLEFRKIVIKNLFNKIDLDKLTKLKTSKDILMPANNLIQKYIGLENSKIKKLEEEISQQLKYEEMLKQNKESEELVLKNSKDVLKYLGTPISIKKIKHILKEYFTKLNYGTEDDINYMVNSIIQQNISLASRNFLSGATNAFYCENLKDNSKEY